MPTARRLLPLFFALVGVVGCQPADDQTPAEADAGRLDGSPDDAGDGRDGAAEAGTGDGAAGDAERDVGPAVDGEPGDGEPADLDRGDAEAADINPTDSDAPDRDAPDSDEPDLDTPDLDAPDLDAPDSDAPDLDAPDLAPPARCGDGLITGDEGCDDGEGNSDDAPDACRSDCQPARCGDDVIDTGEGCDNGAGNSDATPDACRSDCQPARCGDGIVDATEGCDGDRTCDPASCQPACVDDCALGALGCEGDATIRCGDFDGDACYEWGDVLACGVDEACLDGACVCVDVCAADETRCGGAGVERCVAQADGCLGWQADAVCDALQRCEAGACVRVPLVINEVHYDAVGADTPRVFTELWGPPGTVLDGLTLVGVNGNGGAVYGNVPLVGAIGADGFFVVAHPDAEPGLRGLADLFNRAVDWQNGPDSVQLRRGVEVLDAVGYGDFADAVFAGEGNPAPDVAEVSLTRDARHTDTDDNFADFTAGPPTPRGNPAPVCEEVCAADALRCAGDVSERCGRVDECLGWVVVDDCAAAGRGCVEGVCVAVCEDRCVADALRCVGAVSERCVTVDGCLDWAAEDDCAAVGEVCSAEGCAAPGRCGDRVIDAGETCDDGNVEIGDGCDDACQEEDPFDQRAVLIVRPPAAGTRPDHVPEDIAATTYGGVHALRYDNRHAFVFGAFDDNIRALEATVEIGRGVRLEPGDYAVVINDTFVRVVLDWGDRVVVEASRLEVVTPQRGHYTVRPGRRFDDIARPLPLRGCGAFDNQTRSPWIFGGCDGAIGGGEITLDHGLVVVPGSYRVSVAAPFHSPNATFVDVPAGELAVYAPPDTRARIEVLPPPPGALPDAALQPVPSYGPPARRVPYDNDGFHVFRYVDIVTGFEHVAQGFFGQPAVVPAGRYHVTLNDTYAIVTVGVGELAQVASGRIEVPGLGAFDVVPDPDVRRFTYAADPGACNREGPETYVLASCAIEREGRFARGSGVNVLPGSYEVRVYDGAGALLQVQAVVVN